jgi:hypothetical protein
VQDDTWAIIQQGDRLQAIVAESQAIRARCRMQRAWAEEICRQARAERARWEAQRRELAEQWAMLRRLPNREP